VVRIDAKEFEESPTTPMAARANTGGSVRLPYQVLKEEVREEKVVAGKFPFDEDEQSSFAGKAKAVSNE